MDTQYDNDFKNEILDNNTMKELNEYNKEWLEIENPNRYVLFPIQYEDIWQEYKKAVSVFWVPEEVEFSKDMKDWVKLNANEQYFIKYVLAFFAGSDGIVMENLGARFINEVQIPEIKAFYTNQIFMENIHSETYSRLIDQYVSDEKEKATLFNAIAEIPCIKMKAEWAIKWIKNQQASFATRLLAFSLVEGLFFSGSFCAIYWLKDRGLMPGLTQSNELISRDEGLHTDFAVLIYSKLKYKLSQNSVEEIFKEAVEIEKNFICESIPCDLIGMNKTLMVQYIEFVADRLLTQLGYKKIWNTKNPFTFMDFISMRGKTNFFEKRVTEYAKDLHTTTKNENHDDLFNADF